MEFKERSPIETTIDRDPQVEPEAPLGFENIKADLEGAIQAVGADEVAAALLQVQTGRARPEELLHWIDELRDPELEKPVDETPPEGFMHDFEYDTEIANGETEEQGDDGLGGTEQRANESDLGGGDDDGHYLFSAVRRKAQADDDDGGDGDGGGGGGGGGGDDGKPKPKPVELTDAKAKAKDAKAAKAEPKAASPKPSKPSKDPNK